MPSNRCSNCAINYPDSDQFKTCFVCDSELTYFNNIDASPEWEEEVAWKLKDIDSVEDIPELQSNFTYPHRHDAVARVYKDASGELWITHTELLDAGYKSLEDFAIVFVNGSFYELQGYSEAANSWWVEEVNRDVPDAPEA